MKTFLTDLKKNIFSPKFLFSFLILTMLCLLSDAPTVSARQPFSVFDEIVKFRRDVWMKQGYLFSSEAIFVNFDNSLWYVIVLPIISAFPIVYNFSDEWFGDNYIMTLSRVGYKKYVFGKLFSAFITGALTAVIGIMLYGAIVYSIFPPADSFDSEGTSQSLIIAKIINNALVCGMYAALSILVCLVLKDKFFTLSIFMILNYFSLKLEIKFQNTADMSLEKNRLISGLFPSRHTSLYYIIPENIYISFYWYAVFIAAALTVTAIISYCVIRRRYKYAA